MGHDEAPFLDGRGLRVGLALPMVYPASLVSVHGFRGDLAGARGPRSIGGQYSEGSRRVVAWRGRTPEGPTGPSTSASVMIHRRVDPRS